MRFNITLHKHFNRFLKITHAYFPIENIGGNVCAYLNRCHAVLKVSRYIFWIYDIIFVHFDFVNKQVISLRSSIKDVLIICHGKSTDQFSFVCEAKVS